MTVIFGNGNLGEITAGSRRYRLTWDDLLWAGKMLYGECGPTNGGGVEGAAVLWSMASRFMHLQRYNSYREFIQAYSQPINPKFLADGLFCRVGGRNHGREECSQDKLDRRARIHAMTWEQIPGDIQDLVHKWAEGKINNPVPKATDFAVPRVANRPGAPQFELIWDTLGRPSNSRDSNGNAFYSIPASRNWSSRYVKVILDTREASDANIEEVSTATRPFGQRSQTSQGQRDVLLQPPPNDLFENISEITSDRTDPPSNQYDYETVQGNQIDNQARAQLDLQDEDRLLKINRDRFWDQISNLKTQSTLTFSQMVPVIQITTERDEGGVINLNEEIFSKSPFHGYNEEFNFFPDRPLASIESFTVSIQEPRAGGATGISTAVLTLRVHNPQMVRRDHPTGKYIAYMMSQGFVIRVKYGVEGSYNLDTTSQNAFQWKEEDFFVTQFNCKIENNGSTTLTINLMPATHRLLQQMRIGESIPASNLGRISQTDIDNAIQSAVSNALSATNEQTDQLRSRLSAFRFSYNSALESPGLRLQSLGSGTFGSTLHAALTNAQIFQQEEGVQPVEIPNLGNALQTIQSTLLTRRFENILRNDCYRHSYMNISYNAVNIGPLISNLVKPEVDAAFGYVSQNQIEIGPKFSIDGNQLNNRSGEHEGNVRNKIRLIFGLFNQRAGHWADKPISCFPINVNSIFSHLRQQRIVGSFASTINEFIVKLNDLMEEPENYNIDTSQGSSPIRYRIEIPQIKYLIYPDPSDETSWIMYFYDNKYATVSFRDAVDEINQRTETSGRIPTREEMKEILAVHKIPWVEMGDQGSFIKEFNAETRSDDALFAHNLHQLNRQSFGIRDQDASIRIPAGISRDFALVPQGATPQETIRQTEYRAPVSLSLQSFCIPTAYFTAPIFVFFPLRVFTGVYNIMDIRHDINKNGASTNISLQINLSQINRIAE